MGIGPNPQSLISYDKCLLYKKKEKTNKKIIIKKLFYKSIINNKF